jgi:demethylmenaquinone methyltransferase / 2-methoxy-6-polyprenyl-1,4-benzoquinol methylase
VRNFADRAVGLAEVYRALKPGGLWGFLEMTAPQGKIFPFFYGLYFKLLVPLIGAAISFHPYAYRYLKNTVYAFPGFTGMKAEHETIGFQLHYYRPIMRGAVGLYIFKKP